MLTVLNGVVRWHDSIIVEQGKVTIAAGERLSVELPTLRVALAPMPGGDVAFICPSGVVGIERKGGADAVASWYSGHLAEQLAIMLDNYQHVLLLLEDRDAILAAFLAYGDSAGTYRHWRDDLLTFQESGVRLYETANLAESGSAVDHLYWRYQRKQHGALYRPRLSKGLHIYRRMLLTVPDWGIETTESALKELETPYRVFTAKPERLERTRLVTPRRLRMLFESIGRKVNGKVHGSGSARCHADVDRRRDNAGRRARRL